MMGAIIFPKYASLLAINSFHCINNEFQNIETGLYKEGALFASRNAS